MNTQEAIVYIKTTPREAMDTLRLVLYESAFRNNKEFALEYAKAMPERYDYLSSVLKNDKEVMKAHITGDMGPFFAIANPMKAATYGLQNDKIFIVDCMEAKPKNIIPIFEGIDRSLKELVLNHPDVIQKTEALPILKACIELDKRGVEYKAGDNIIDIAEKTLAHEKLQSTLAQKQPSPKPSMKLKI